MCPNCRAFVTSDDKVCPYCQVQLGPRATDRRNPGETMGVSADQFSTMIILVMITGLYVVTGMRSAGGFMNMDSRTLVDFGAMYAPYILDPRDHQWWRLITAGFLHGGVFHIAMNAWVLWDLGPQVEHVLGTPRFVTIFIASTITGFTASMFWSSGIPSVGASAALCGLIGAMVGLGTKERNSIAGMMRGRFLQWMLMLVVFGFFFPGVDNAAHLGGFAGGFVLAYLAGSPSLRDSTEGVWKLASLAAMALTAYAFVEMALQVAG